MENRDTADPEVLIEVAKERPAPPPGESVKLFEELFDIIYRWPYGLEVKRPRVP